MPSYTNKFQTPIATTLCLPEYLRNRSNWPQSSAPCPDCDGYESESDEDEDDETLEEWGFHSLDLADAMGAMILDEDPDYLDWMPSWMQKDLLRREKMKKGMD